MCVCACVCLSVCPSIDIAVVASRRDTYGTTDPNTISNQPGVLCRVDPGPNQRVDPFSRFSLYTTLPLLILYGVWHTQEGVVEGSCIAQ